jgi:triosephosphate isomerase
VSRARIVAGNFKLHLAPAATQALVTAIAAPPVATRVRLVVFPTALSIAAALDAAEDRVDVGVQWVAPTPSGAFTGTNSAALAASMGVRWALVGHSEVRRDLGETDARCAASLLAALDAGLRPLLCVGETLAERDAGALEAVLSAQLRTALDAVPGAAWPDVAIAYEPVWAIGTGVVASPEQAQAAHAYVRATLAAAYGEAVAACVPILYGGSVTPENAATLMALPDVDGVLVGGASLDAAKFRAIASAAV